MSEAVEAKKISRHSAQLTVELKVGGAVDLHIDRATAEEVLTWLQPILAYLRERAREEAGV